MKSDRRAPVAIIGGGFSGTALLAELTRRGVSALLIEGSGRAGQGTAYSTREPAHVLNVRAEVMSARADDAAHFARFVEAEGGTAKEFVQRRQFGRYLLELLAEAQAGGGTVREGQAVAAERTDRGWTVQLAGGDEIAASALVLAMGNQPPEQPRAFAGAGPRFVNDPWSGESRKAVQAAAASGADVLLLGTGLTMVDVALSLDAAGHQGAIVALSRRGLMPRGHADQPALPAPVTLDEVPQGNVLVLWRWLRARTRTVDWRAAVDSLRPHAQTLWQRFGEKEQRRFIRHARPWWDVHRHRIAPEVARSIKAMIVQGRLELAAGRIRAALQGADGIDVTIARRGRRQEHVRSFGYVFNCTGPLGAIDQTGDALLRQLFDQGMVWPDPLGISLDVDERSRPTGTERLWALGPITKGKFWEIIAVPDIRVQVAAVADDIAKELDQ
jgi:uncharacterized NAD(P)/FAD-binding protein YdhS